MSEPGWTSNELIAAVPEWIAANDRRQAVTSELVLLMDRHQHSLFGFLVVMLGDRDGAGDCTQDTFLRAFAPQRHITVVNPLAEIASKTRFCALSRIFVVASR